VFDHARPHTYSPDLADLLRHVITWLSSHLGVVLWDLILQAVTIFITVWVIERWLEWREQRRWYPARQFLYSQLFGKADYLVLLLPWERWSNLGNARYLFAGSRSYGTKAFREDFTESVWRMDASEFEERVQELAGKPELITSFEKGFDNTLGPWAGIFLAQEPELNMLINEVRERFSDFKATLERYRRRSARRGSPPRESREYFNVEGPLKEAMDQALDRTWEQRMEEVREEARGQACIALKRLVLAAYDLRRWLTDQADSVEPSKQ
jgi:hypothetical protein